MTEEMLNQIGEYLGANSSVVVDQTQKVGIRNSTIGIAICGAILLVCIVIMFVDIFRKMRAMMIFGTLLGSSMFALGL